MVSFVTYRTKLLSQAKAESFAKALRSNDRFAFVTVEKSPRAKSEKAWLVRFEPSNAARKAALVDAAQDARTERALCGTFTFAVDPDRPHYHCFSHQSGECYTLDLNTCDCPDETYRCSHVGLACKHRIALALALRAGEVGEFTPVNRGLDQERFAEAYGDVDELFGVI